MYLEKTKISKKIVAAGAVTLILAAIAGVIALAGYKIAIEFKGLGEYFIERLDDLPGLVKEIEDWLITNIAFLPDSIEKTVSGSINEFADKALTFISEKGAETVVTEEASSKIDLSFLSGPIGSIISTAKQIPMFFTATLISIVACYLYCRQG